MKLIAADILPIAAATGFQDEMIEKVLHLIGLLGALNAHPFLKGRWALKGGTALNLFVLDAPRLSLDIDLNYVGAFELAVDDVDSDADELGERLLPTLNVRERGDDASPVAYARRLVKETREALSAVLPLAENERAFLELLLDRGEIDPTLLTDDLSLQDRIRRQPLLEWKAQNVRQHFIIDS